MHLLERIWRNRDAQRSKNLQSFWCWVKGNFLLPWKCGRFGPSISVLHWHSETSISIYASRKAILPPKNYAVNFTFISWHFHWYKVSFLFLRALTPGSIKSCKEIQSNPKSHVPNSQESCMYTLPNSQQPPHQIKCIESELHTQKQQLYISVQCFFWCKTSLHLQGFQCKCRLEMNFFFFCIPIPDGWSSN